MFFASDNAGPAHPKVMDALMRANEGFASAYGTDPIMAEVTERARALFEAPEAAVYLVATGTAANVLGLATLCQPWQTIFCTPLAHINVDECNAPEFYTGGAKLTLVGEGDKMTAEALEAAILGEEVRGVHGAQRGPVALTNVTERGRVYSGSELAALCAVARRHGLPVHLDGARFANACLATNLSPAEMTWKIGVDAVSFGGTKNGLLGVEAVVFFDPDRAMEFEYRRKRGGHLFSKHRYLSAQMQAYLADDLWRETAAAANARAARLAEGLRGCAAVTLTVTPQANMLFCALPRGLARRLQAAGAQFAVWEGTMEGDAEGMVEIRLVCDWSLPEAEIDRFVALAAAG
jgi:threonine aldolase